MTRAVIWLVIAAASQSSCKARSSALNAETDTSSLPADYVYWAKEVSQSLDYFPLQMTTDRWIDSITSRVEFYVSTGSLPKQLVEERLVPLRRYLEAQRGGYSSSLVLSEGYRAFSANKFQGTLELNRSSFEVSALEVINQRRKEQGLGPILWSNYRNSFLKHLTKVYYIPGTAKNPDVDEWVQLSTGIVQGIAVDKSVTPQKAYFFSGSVGETKIYTGATMTEACTTCHKSGAPLHIGLFADESVGVRSPKDLNQIIARYDTANIRPARFPSAPESLPGLGSGNLDTDHQCINCHDGATAVKILPPFGGAIRLIIDTKRMPPESTRAVSAPDILKAYRSEFRKWLLGN